MLAALIFLNLTIIERLINLNLGFMVIGLGDLFIVFFLILNIFLSKKLYIDKGAFYLAIGFFVIILISIISNSTYFGLNTLITIPAKIIVASIIASQIISTKFDSRYILMIDFNIFLFALALIFLSDGSPFLNFEFFNRNETIAYISCLFALRTIYLFHSQKIRFSSIQNFLSPLILISLCSFLVQSRQSIISIIFFALFFYLSTSMSAFSFFKRGILSCGVIALLIFGLFNINLGGYSDSRLDTIRNLEPSNRADKQRLANLLQSLQGFQESPIVGKGPTSFLRNNIYNKVAHNTYASTLYELGLLGMLILFIFIRKLLYPLFARTYDTSNLMFLKAAGSFAIFFIIQSFFIEAFPKAPMYILLACSIFVKERLKYIQINSQK